MHGEFDHDRSQQNNLQRFKALHYEIIRLHWLLFSRDEVAKLCGVTTQTVSNTINSDIGHQELTRLQGDRAQQNVYLKERIAEAQPIALKVILEDMQSDNVSPSTRGTNARFVLGELGGLTIKESQSKNNHLSPAQMEAIKQLALATRTEQNRSEVESAEEVKYEEIKTS